MTTFGSLGCTTMVLSYQPCVPISSRTLRFELADMVVSDQDPPPSVVLNTCEVVTPVPSVVASIAYSVLVLDGAMASDIRSTSTVVVETGRPVAAGAQVAPLSMDFRTVGDANVFGKSQVLTAHQRPRSQVAAYNTAGFEGSRTISATSPYAVVIPGPSCDAMTVVHVLPPSVERSAPRFVPTIRSSAFAG